VVVTDGTEAGLGEAGLVSFSLLQEVTTTIAHAIGMDSQRNFMARNCPIPRRAASCAGLHRAENRV
jgi:hypothetical protein